jgi:hypothetical protein
VSTFAAACLALGLLAGGENRLWFVDLELRGACAGVRLECGSDGETLLRGPFSRGEDRRLSVPVPVRSPLGAEGLVALPLPRAVPEPAGAEAVVRVLGWSAVQPAAELARVAGPLLALTRPPGGAAEARARAPELFLVLVAGAALLVLRRRLVPALVVALASGALAFELARGRAASGAQDLVQWSLDAPIALAVRAGADELEGPREWLEVSPEGHHLGLEWEAGGEGRVRAAGARLIRIGTAPVPSVSPARNGGEELSEVWTRDPRGGWRAHGTWRTGEGLPGADPSLASAPPGWLASALPAGTGVLVARTAGGTWLRCLGFPAD